MTNGHTSQRLITAAAMAPAVGRMIAPSPARARCGSRGAGDPASPRWTFCTVFTFAGHNGPMKVVVTRIEPDGTMQRRVVDTAWRDDGAQWEDLAARALAFRPPYRPIPGTAV